MTTAPSDADLLGAMRLAAPHAAVVARRPYRYATSHALEELSVRDRDGSERTLILKRLTPRPDGKPAFLHDPRREPTTARAILAPAGIGPRLIAAGDDWLLLERVAGVELWQVGAFAVWEQVARWLADFHMSFAGRADALRAAHPRLLAHDAAWYGSWRDRAAARLRAGLSSTGGGDPRAAELLAALLRYDPSALAGLPPTLVHGELYPSNVLVAPPRVCPVDWEMAAIGTGLIDLAALVSGWDAAHRARLVAAYGDVDEVALTRARLALALQWLGWTDGWTPPPEHAHDWLGEALSLTRELGL